MRGEEVEVYGGADRRRAEAGRIWVERRMRRSFGCIGWGSLLWDPRELQIRRPWFRDGPLLPIEFAREADNGRITLVVCDTAYRVRTYWVLLDVADLGAAKNALAAREGVRKGNIEKFIGSWEAASGRAYGAGAENIAQWGSTKGLDGVVWANLEVGLKRNRGVVPSMDDVLEYLRKLPRDQGKLAEEYIRKAPLQIDTEYRRRLARELGWLPQG